MKKILVTGATGFIGNYVVDALLKKGVEVIATSSSAEKARQFAWFSNVQYQEFDFSRFDAGVDYMAFFNHPDAIIHLAWEGLPNYKSLFHLEVNFPRHLAFLKNVIQHGLTDITITGTCFEYGMKEGLLTEDMSSDPANPYARAKDSLRKSLQEWQLQHAFHLKWIRLFYMYGKGQNPNSLLSQLDKALLNGDEAFNMSGGEQERDYLPVEQVAEYIVRIALQQRTEGIINCCSGRPVTVKQFVQDYLEKKGQHIRLNLGFYPYPDYEPMRFWGSIDKLNGIIN